MIIQTPSDLATYLISLATQHPAVRHVVYGEHSRSEADALAASQYPQVDIETPVAHIPVQQGQARLTTRMYVLTNTPGGLIADEDISSAITFAIARDLINLIIRHTGSGYIDIELDSNAPIQITPIVAMGSDQRRGCMFPLEFLIDSDQCTDDLDMDSLVIPQFSYSVDGSQVNITDLTHGSTSDDVTLTWYKRDSDDTASSVIDIYNEVQLIPDDDASWYMHLWLKVEIGTHTLWAYALVSRAEPSGRSTSFVPLHPV